MYIKVQKRTEKVEIAKHDDRLDNEGPVVVSSSEENSHRQNTILYPFLRALLIFGYLPILE